MSILKVDFSEPPASLTIAPGLTWVLGEDQRPAHELFETICRVAHASAPDIEVYWQPALVRANMSETGNHWLAAQGRAYIRWHQPLCEELVDALSLGAHIDKPLYMFSLGSVRKLNLVAAFASGADIACLETPFAALDGPSRAVVTELLWDASEHNARAWLVFDFEISASLAQASTRAVIEV